MLSNGNTSIAYNDFKLMPRVPYMILERLATLTTTSAENLWKILKYPTKDALSKPNLTFAEKMAMVWKPEEINSSQENLYNVFLKPLVPSALNTAEEQTQIRIYKQINKATQHVQAVIGYQFDLITQEACSMLYDEADYLVERTDLMEAYLLDCLNGADISIGSSFFTFYTRDLNAYAGSRLSINNGKSLYGRSVVMTLTYINADTGGVCS